MRLSQSLFLLLIFFFKGCDTTNISHEQPCYCHDEESSALLQFKQSFTIDASASGLEGAYPKVSSWKSAQGGNNTCCCAWDGVECDEETGYVIGLDLSSSCLYGSINSNSSLFRLVHLQRLSLANNHFNYSQIPTTIRNFPSLTQLDLSASVFSGRVPSELSQLIKLSSLNLSFNTDPSSGQGLLRLDGSDFRSLVQNLTRLEHLRLRFINISSTIPHSMANLSFLTTLDLHQCELFGDFPVRIFQLQSLQSIYVRDNQDLIGYLPEFNRSSLLRTLDIHGTRFFGNLPSSIGRIGSLKQLDVAACNFSEGVVPSWIGNLGQLTYLDISANKFGGPIPESFVNLTKLTVFRISLSELTGPIPTWLGNFNKLNYLNFAYNRLNGSIPPSFSNLTNLEILYLQNNELSGIIPASFSKLTNLENLNLQFNELTRMVPASFSNLTNLRMLDVSQNQLQGQLPRSLANCLMLETLILSENNFNDVFPSWLRTLPELKLLAMRKNGFGGVIRKPENNQAQFPKLHVLDLSYNNFTGEFLPEYILTEYAMRSNISDNQLTYMSSVIYFPPVLGFQWINYGSRITITTKGVDRYYSQIQEAFAVIDISSNNFVGKIDEWIGNLKGLWSLNVSNNLLTGGIPSSFGSLTHLESLDLSNNKLLGEIPQQLVQLTFLSQFNVSHNKLTGSIPRGAQFNTFGITSYEGNSGLCGDPLPKKCGNSNTPAQPPPSSIEENDSGSGIEFDWKFVLAGFGSGLVMGVVLADVAILRRRELFLRIVGILIELMEMITSWKRFGRRT